MEKLEHLITEMEELIDSLEEFTGLTQTLSREDASSLYRTEEFMKFLLIASNIHQITKPTHELVLSLGGNNHE